MKKRELFLAVLLFCFLSQSCTKSPNSKQSANITIESGEIPPDMATEKFVLIGRLYQDESYDKYLVKEFDKYTGEKLLATDSDISDRYSDVNKYRYVLEYYTEKHGHTDMHGHHTSVSVKHFYIYDQKTATVYKRNETSGFFAQQIRSYLSAIDAVRQK